MNSHFKYGDLTEKIIGCAMKAHSGLGGGNFTENIFHRALLLELNEAGLTSESEKEFPVYYKGSLIGKKRIDILVEKKVLIELKSTSTMQTMHFNQLINYLKIFDIEVGLLINFGTQSLEFKRFVNQSQKP